MAHSLAPIVSGVARSPSYGRFARASEARYHHGMRLTWMVFVAMVGGCPAPRGTQRPYPAPTVADLAARLDSARAAMTSFRADSTMDYWIGDQRAKGEVLVMGELGAKLRFAALSPAGGSSMVEMACNGDTFVYVDYQNNCVLTGPCDERSIAQFFRIELAPDDFVHLAVGTPPIISRAGSLSYDGGKEKLVLTGEQGTQTLWLNLEGGKLDVLAAELVGPNGKNQWSVTNGEFIEINGQRVPRKTRFKSPSQQQDLLVDWGEAQNRAINVKIAPERFQLVAPTGLPRCDGR